MEQKSPVVSRRTAEVMFSLIQDQQISKISIKDFCAQNGLTEATFYYWRKKYLNTAEAAMDQQPGNFSLLQLDGEAEAGPRLFAEYNGLKLYQQVPVSFLKELMS